MKYLIYLFAGAVLCASLNAADFTAAREAVVSKLQSWKEAAPGKDPWTTSTSGKLDALSLALPTSDASFKSEIQKGIGALSEIQNQGNDAMVLDLFVLARSFADYYRFHKDTPEFLQNTALVAAFKSFESGESNDPLAYFNTKLRPLLFTYRHYYPLFNEPVPERIKACQIEYIGSAYIRGEAEGPDTEMVYAVTSNWTLAYAKLKTMPIAGRNAAIQSIEEALDADGLFTPEIEAVARQHLAEAKAFFGQSP